MTRRTVAVAIAAMAVLAAATAFVLFGRSEKSKIKKRFTEIADTVSKRPGEGNIAAAAKMLALGGMLTDNVTVEISDLPHWREMTSEDIVSLAARGRGYMDELHISILDVETEILGEDKARSRCRAKVRLKSSYSSFNENRIFTADLVKQDGKWRFSAFREDNLIKK